LDLNFRLAGGYESDKNNIMLYNIETNESTPRTLSIDLSFESSVLSSRHIYATAQFRGATRIFKMNLSTEDGNDLYVMKGDSNRGNIILLENEGVEEALYFVESTLVSAQELKLARLKLHSEAIFEKFLPVPIESLNGGENSIQTKDLYHSRGFLDAFVLCPEYSNGDKMMPDVTQHFITGGGIFNLSFMLQYIIHYIILYSGLLPHVGGDTVHLWYLPPTFAPTTER